MFYEYSRIDSPDYIDIEEKENYSFPEHLHICYEVIIILNGKMQVTIDGVPLNLTQGDAALIFPHQHHSLESTNSKHILCIFSPNVVKAFHYDYKKSSVINQKFQPDEYTINSLIRLTPNSSIVEKKAVLYSFCAQYAATQNTGITSSWSSVKIGSTTYRALKTTFADPIAYNNGFCVFSDENTTDISNFIENSYFTLLIQSSMAKHTIRLMISNYNMTQYMYTDITVKTANKWQRINIPLKDMVNSDKVKEIRYLNICDKSRNNTIQTNDYISISNVKIVHSPSNETIWQITSKTSESLPKYRRQSKDNHLLFEIFSFIEKNFNSNCSLEELAKITGYDYTYLSRYFKNVTNISFNSYVNNFRLNHACYLLNNTNESIMNCALNSGYNSIRTFNRNFKETLGMTPEEFRLKNKANQ